MITPTLLSILVVLATGAGPSEADKLIDQGVDLREQGKDVDALAKFQQAYDLSKSPRAMAQIGLAEQALGRWLDAEAHLEQAAAAKTDPWIKPRLAALESALDKVRERVGSIEIFGPAGTDLKLNGKAAGKLPLPAPVKVLAGSVTVELGGGGYLPVSRTITVSARSLTRETIDLVKEEKPVVAATPPPNNQTQAQTQSTKTSAAPAATAGSSNTASTNVSSSGGGGGLETYAWIAGGAAVVSLGVGTAFLFVRNGHISSYNDDTVCLAGGLTRDENCHAELESADSAGTLMTVGLIGAGVFGAASALLFVLDSPSGPEPTPKKAASGVKVSCGVGIGIFGVSCAGEF